LCGPIRQTDDGKLLIPRYNKAGELRAYQTIAPDGEKKYQWQGEIKGTFHEGEPVIVSVENDRLTFSQKAAAEGALSS